MDTLFFSKKNFGYSYIQFDMGKKDCSFPISLLMKIKVMKNRSNSKGLAGVLRFKGNMWRVVGLLSEDSRARITVEAHAYQ